GGTVNRPPPPMPEREVERMLGRVGAEVPGIQHGKPKFDRGDRVKVKDGTFAGMEGEVKDILEAKGLVRVELTIFGRPVPVELEYGEVDKVCLGGRRWSVAGGEGGRLTRDDGQLKKAEGMEKQVPAQIRLQVRGGGAPRAPPVGPALGQHGVNIGQFVSQ